MRKTYALLVMNLEFSIEVNLLSFQLKSSYTIHNLIFYKLNCNTLGVSHLLSSVFEIKHDMLSDDHDL
jgi:hypothetical protein